MSCEMHSMTGGVGRSETGRPGGRREGIPSPLGATMFKPVLGLAALGVAGYVAYKMVMALLVPVMALMAGLLIFAIKGAVAVLLVWLAYRLYRKLMATPTTVA